MCLKFTGEIPNRQPHLEIDWPKSKKPWQESRFFSYREVTVKKSPLIAEIFPVSPGPTLGAVDFEVCAKIPFENAAALYVERKSAGGYLGQTATENSIENELEIEIISGKDLESQYEEEIPSQGSSIWDPGISDPEFCVNSTIPDQIF